MAAISFYKFAAAMMELLEPDKYSFSRKVAVETELNTFNDNVVAVPMNPTANLNGDAELINLAPTDSLKNLSSSIEVESKTVAVVVEHLTDVIANASDGNLVKVAAAIQEVTAEDISAVAAPNEIAQLAEVISDTNLKPVTVAEAVQSVQATLAIQTTNEINQIEILSNLEATSNLAEHPIKALETRATEVVTAAITDKIEQEVKLFGSGLSNIESRSNELPSSKSSDVPEVITKPIDFWELFPEMAVSDVRYLNTVSYLYGFMSDNNLFDALNPERGFNEKYALITKFIGDAGEQRAIETRIDNILAEGRNESEKSSEQMSEREQKTIEETSRIARSIESKQTQERQERLIREREKLAERLVSERLKAPM